MHEFGDSYSRNGFFEILEKVNFVTVIGDLDLRPGFATCFGGLSWYELSIDVIND